jgi:hypothetical protein
MSLLIPILIVYGITLIIVQSHIFEGVRHWFSEKAFKANVSLKTDTTDMATLFVDRNSVLLPSELTTYDTLIADIQKFSSTDPEFTEATTKIQLLFEVTQLRLNLVKKISTWTHPVYLKFHKLVNCMMCVSFWVGMGLALISQFFPLVICSTPIVIIDGTGTLLTFAISVLLVSFLFSGTTWAINAIVDYFDEQKSK